MCLSTWGYTSGALLGMVAIVVVRADAPSSADSFSLDKTPTAIAGPLGQLRDAPTRGERAAAARKLSEISEAEPYLRAFCATPAGKLEGYGPDALTALQTTRGKRNAKRLEAWAKEGRYDLMIDASLDLSDVSDTRAFGELLLKLVTKSREVPKQFGAPEGRHRFAADMNGFYKLASSYKDLSERGLLKTDHKGSAFVRAGSLETTSRLRQTWLVVTRDHLNTSAKTPDMWEDCCLFHNNDVEVEVLDWTFLVCDGDVTFKSGGLNCNGSTIIARGSVRSPSWFALGASGSIYSDGDIVAPKGMSSKGMLMAAGKIDVPSKEGPERVIKAGVKENPFGVRFFETADVGTEATVKDGVLTIGKLTPGSPLTKFGVKPGDVVTQLNDKPIKTANDFRRELRNSVALEAGIFYITRDGTKITRVVYFHNGLEK